MPSARLIYLAIPLLAACAINPTIPSGENVQIHHVVERVKCEVKDAVEIIERDFPRSWRYLKEWTGSFILRLTVEEGVGFAPTIVVVNSPIAGQLLGINTPLTFASSARRNVSLTFGFDAINAQKLTCESTTIFGRPLTSNLGLREWLVESLMPFEQQSALVQPAVVISNLDFIIDTTGQTTPAITMRAVSGGTITDSALFRANKRDTHTLEATFRK